MLRSVKKEMNEDDPLGKYNLLISGPSLEQIANMSDDEISYLANERLGYPGQNGFLLRPEHFRSKNMQRKR
jgi:hypothetical protein